MALVHLHGHLVPRRRVTVPAKRHDRPRCHAHQVAHLGTGEHHGVVVAQPEPGSGVGVAAGESGGADGERRDGGPTVVRGHLFSW